MAVMMETKECMDGIIMCVCVCLFLFLARIESSIARRNDGWNYYDFFFATSVHGLMSPHHKFRQALASAQVLVWWTS